MFDTSALIDVGKELERLAPSNVYPEAMYRSSIGRYYYACYHASKSLCIRNADWDNKDKSSHKAVASALRKKNRFLASMLDDLRLLREHADYHVWRCKELVTDDRHHPRCDCDWDPDTRSNCAKASNIAKWIADELKKSRSQAP